MRRPRWLGGTPAPPDGGPRTVQAWFDHIERQAVPVEDQFFAFNNVGYWVGSAQQWPTDRSQERIGTDFAGLVSDALCANSVIFSCERLRVRVFSEATFCYQRLDAGQPGELHASPYTRLAALDHPWTNATTGDLTARMLLHADFGGNAFVVRRPRSPGKLRVLRPDWVTIIMGTDEGPADPNDVETDVIAYAYWPGGIRTGRIPDVFTADEVAHFAPMPHPSAHYIGMSWLTPVIAELEADQAATQHKLQFFRNGATLQTVIMVDKDAAMNETAFKRMMAKVNAETRGVANAYKTLFVTGGVDAKVVGADLRQLDFKVTQGAGETRIAAAAGTPPILVGLSEGLNAGQYNIYGQAKRAFVDGELRPLWRNWCGSMETLIVPPAGSRLWYKADDIAYLREDATDRATIMRERAGTIQVLINAGYKPDDVIAAVAADDLSLLEGKHTGLYSVQLQPPSAGTMNDTAPPAGPPALPPAGPPAGPPGGQSNPNGSRVPAMAGRTEGGA